MAVGLIVLLLERSFVELLQAEGADEVLGVELLAHGGDAAACDWLLAARAERAAPLVVVDLAVGLALVLEEAAVDEGGEALLRIRDISVTPPPPRTRPDRKWSRSHPADEALGVPEAAQSRDVVLQDGPSTAATFGSKHVEVVLPAVGFTVLLMETCTGSQTQPLTN